MSKPGAPEWMTAALGVARLGHHRGMTGVADGGTGPTVSDLVDRLDEDVVRRLLGDAAVRDEETGRAVRLAAAGPSERLEVLAAEVDSGLRTRRHLGYWDAPAWAAAARPLGAALGHDVEAGPHTERRSEVEK